MAEMIKYVIMTFVYPINDKVYFEFWNLFGVIPWLALVYFGATMQKPQDTLVKQILENQIEMKENDKKIIHSNEHIIELLEPPV